MDKNFYYYTRADHFKIFRSWVRGFIIPIYLCFSLVDYYYCPDQFVVWFLIRISVAAIWFFIPYLYKYLFIRQHFDFFTLFVMSFAQFSVDYMILTSGDFDKSPYVLGTFLCYVTQKNSFIFSKRFDSILIFTTFAPLFYICLAAQNWTLLFMLAGCAITSFFSSFIRLMKDRLNLNYKKSLEKEVSILRRDLSKEYQQRLSIIEKQALTQATASATAKITHDLKAPFQMIKILSEQLKSKHEFENLIPYLDESLNYVDNLMKNILLNYQPNLQQEKINLDTLIDFSWAQVKHINPSIVLERNIAIKTIFVDKIQCERLFINLFKNALEAMNPKDKVWITVKQNKVDGIDRAEIEIGNTGSTIPPNRLKTLFLNFESFGKKHGVGLGLSVCTQVVQGHNGKISCLSDVNNGTRFIFDLPVLPSV